MKKKGRCSCKYYSTYTSYRPPENSGYVKVLEPRKLMKKEDVCKKVFRKMCGRCFHVESEDHSHDCTENPCEGCGPIAPMTHICPMDFIIANRRVFFNLPEVMKWNWEMHYMCDYTTRMAVLCVWKAVNTDGEEKFMYDIANEICEYFPIAFCAGKYINSCDIIAHRIVSDMSGRKCGIYPARKPVYHGMVSY